MNYYKRNETIKKLYASDMKPKVIAKKYEISVSRVYQVLRKEKKYCEKHDREYYSMCVNCNHEKNLVLFLTTGDVDLKQKLEILRSGSQHPELESIRREVIVKLKDKYGLSFPAIGGLINKTHGTVLYHYNKA